MELKFIVFFFIFISHVSFNQAQAGIASRNKNISNIKIQLAEYSNEITGLAAQINSIEKDLGSKNSHYIENIKKIDTLSEISAKLSFQVKKLSTELATEKKQYQKLIDAYINNSFYQDNELNVVSKQVYLEKLKTIKVSISENELVISQLESELTTINRDINDARSIEQTMGSVIRDLESRKADLSTAYVDMVATKNKLEKQIDIYNLDRKSQKLLRTQVSNGKNFLPPIVEYVDYQNERDGLNFYYRDTVTLQATETGEIAFVGNLGAYGDVIMIDHGNDIRSVILGKLQTKLKKGTKVNKGQVIGYALTNASEKKNVYFEVREKNVVQKSVNWLDKDKLFKKI
jgi:septal ring factor EnvC (AmiA/AmiB activator)